MSGAQEAIEIIRKKAPNFKPHIGIILGSGLGPLAESLTNTVRIPFESIPSFPKLSIEGHGGVLHLGYLHGVPIACLQGRSHFYEGYSHLNEEKTTERLITPVRTLKLLGCEILIATNASGSLRESVVPGDLVLINDHINFQFMNPLVGDNDDTFGPRFVGMEDAYDPLLRKQFHAAAAANHLTLTEGVYVGVLGPSFETPAEIRAFRILGADVIAMSTIPEVIAARHCGMKVSVISVISNMAAGMSNEKLSHEVTLSGAKKGIEKLILLITTFIKNFSSN